MVRKEEKGAPHHRFTGGDRVTTYYACMYGRIMRRNVSRLILYLYLVN
jgi:hypothetical protein